MATKVLLRRLASVPKHATVVFVPVNFANGVSWITQGLLTGSHPDGRHSSCAHLTGSRTDGVAAYRLLCYLIQRFNWALDCRAKSICCGIA